MTCCTLLIAAGVSLVVLMAYFLNRIFNVQLPERPPNLDGYYGEGEAKPDNTEIKPFRVEVPDDVLDDLKARIRNTRYYKPLEDVKFNYGFNPEYLKEIADHWLEKYDWRKYEAEINEIPQFKTEIEGLHIHFWHVQPPKTYSKVIPLLICHGWPGSVWEFHTIIGMLTDPAKYGLSKTKAFEVVAPSIPGFGWSDAPRKQGFGAVESARVFVKLMKRLGLNRFLWQGGDWGSFIGIQASIQYPENIIGLHHTLPQPCRTDPRFMLKVFFGAYFPRQMVNKDECETAYPLKANLANFMLESGYFHLQATKPDTVGFSLNDSPVGLAGYILEKFSTWTNKANRDLNDGGLTEKFSLDELLTNIMIYWTTGTITSSARFLKEVYKDPRYGTFQRLPIPVPTALAQFRHEIQRWPNNFLTYRYPNLKLATHIPRGGHFNATEEPQLLAEHVFEFVDLLD